MNVFNFIPIVDVPAGHIEYVVDLIDNHDARQTKGAYDPGCLSDIVDSIPVLLLPESMSPPDGAIVDVLGFYLHEGEVKSVPAPLIGLYPKVIKAHSNNSDEIFKLLTAKVLVHEFAHALMARTPLSSYYPGDEFFKWMEEPMANMITLQYFSQYDTDDMRTTGELVNAYDYARNFMLNEQPIQYQYGVVMYDLGIHEWWLWRSKKQMLSSLTDNHANGKDDPRKAAWLNMLATNEPNATMKDEQRRAFYEKWWSLVGNQHREAAYQPSEVRAVHDAIANAITERDVEKLAELIDNPFADVGVEDIHGRTALHWAAETNTDEIAKAVFEYDPELVHTTYEAYDATTNELATEITYKMWNKWLPPRTVKTHRARGAFGRF